MPRRTTSAITQPAIRPAIWDLLNCPPCEIEGEVGAEELDDVDVAVGDADEEDDAKIDDVNELDDEKVEDEEGIADEGIDDEVETVVDAVEGIADEEVMGVAVVIEVSVTDVAVDAGEVRPPYVQSEPNGIYGHSCYY